jgi:hypothetical protein
VLYQGKVLAWFLIGIIAFGMGIGVLVVGRLVKAKPSIPAALVEDVVVFNHSPAAKVCLLPPHRRHINLMFDPVNLSVKPAWANNSKRIMLGTLAPTKRNGLRTGNYVYGSEYLNTIGRGIARILYSQLKVNLAKRLGGYADIGALGINSIVLRDGDALSVISKPSPHRYPLPPHYLSLLAIYVSLNRNRYKLPKNHQEEQRVNRYLNALGWLYVVGVISTTCATVASVCAAALCFLGGWFDFAFAAVVCGSVNGLLSAMGAIYGTGYLEDRPHRQQCRGDSKDNKCHTKTLDKQSFL